MNAQIDDPKMETMEGVSRAEGLAAYTERHLREGAFSRELFTPQQVEAMNAKLERHRIKLRQQGGQQLAYIEGWDAIDRANLIFGYGGWDLTNIVHAETSREQNAKGLWEVSYLTRCHLTVYGNAGQKSVHEGVGDGTGVARALPMAISGASKESATDALKRALIHFGNQFGLALYDEHKRGVEAKGVERHPTIPQR
jgi:DNA repair and recombination protein RAD52